jgi:hypothetical protein
MGQALHKKVKIFSRSPFTAADCWTLGWKKKHLAIKPKIAFLMGLIWLNGFMSIHSVRPSITHGNVVGFTYFNYIVGGCLPTPTNTTKKKKKKKSLSVGVK